MSKPTDSRVRARGGMPPDLMNPATFSRLDANEQRVAFCFGHFVNVYNLETAPSLKTVGEILGISERGVRSIVRRLESKGVLIRIRPGGGKNKPTVYMVGDGENPEAILPGLIEQNPEAKTSAKNPHIAGYTRKLESDTRKPRLPPNTEHKATPTSSSSHTRENGNGKPNGTTTTTTQSNSNKTFETPRGLIIRLEPLNVCLTDIANVLHAARVDRGRRRYPDTDADAKDLKRAIRRALRAGRFGELLDTLNDANEWATSGAGFRKALVGAEFLK